MLAPGRFGEFKEHLMAELDSGAAREDEIRRLLPQDLYDLAPLLNLPEDQVARFACDFLHLPYVNRVPTADIWLGVLPKAFSEKNSVVPLRRPRAAVGVVLSNPFNSELLESLNRTLWKGPERYVAVTSPDIIGQLFEPPEDALHRRRLVAQLANVRRWFPRVTR